MRVKGFKTIFFQVSSLNGGKQYAQFVDSEEILEVKSLADTIYLLNQVAIQCFLFKEKKSCYTDGDLYWKVILQLSSSFCL